MYNLVYTYLPQPTEHTARPEEAEFRFFCRS